MNKDNLRMYEHPQEKLSHYSKRTVDLEYRFQFTGGEWGELEGVANRTDYDLTVHSKKSGVDLSYFDQATNERWTPYVIEPAAGVDRARWPSCLMPTPWMRRPTPRAGSTSGLCCGSIHGWRRSRLRCSRSRAAANCRPSPRTSRCSCASAGTSTSTTPEPSGGATAGRTRSARPFSITVDFDTLNDQAVTVRERDSMQQERVGLDALSGYLFERLEP